MKRIITVLFILSALAVSATAATIWVDIQDFFFQPRALYVPVGTTVMWTNRGPSQHTVTSDQLLFQSQALSVGQTYSNTFDATGDFGYHCSIHPFMTATIYVRTPQQMSAMMTLTPTGGQIVIPGTGGNFSYDARGVNQTNNMLMWQYWTRIIDPNNTGTQTYLQNVTVNPMGTRQATFQQNVPGTSPAGEYNFVAMAGINPDCVLTWQTFTFSKSAMSRVKGNWDHLVIVDWHDVPSTPVPSTKTSLSLGNFPEPFNSSTEIRYMLPTAGKVSLEVFSINGSRVATLVNRYEGAGAHQATFSPVGLSSGLYLCRLNVDGQVMMKKMVYAK